MVKKTCKWLSAGGNPDFGEQCIKESEIKEKIKDAGLVIITCGLRGGTGTVYAPLIAQLAKKAGVLTLAIVNMPFSAEGIQRRENAEKGLEKLLYGADTIIIIPNNNLLEVAPNLPVQKSFFVLDEFLCRAVKGITNLIMKPC